jgi:hypothetical protein
MIEITRDEVESWHKIAHEAMLTLIKLKGETGFTGDDLNYIFRKNNFPADVIRKWTGKLFREYQACGYIEKTDEYVLGRHSSPLPIWKAAERD